MLRKFHKEDPHFLFFLWTVNHRHNKRCFITQGSNNKVLCFEKCIMHINFIQESIWVTRCWIARLMILPGLLLMLIIICHQPLHHQLSYARGIDGHSNLHGKHASPCSHLHIPTNPFRRLSPRDVFSPFISSRVWSIGRDWICSTCKLKRR